MEPAAVSIRMLAWPVPVIRMPVPSSVKPSTRTLPEGPCHTNRERISDWRPRVSGEEMVTSPDQHKPTISNRLARFGAVATIVILLAMLFGNHRGRVEDIFLIAFAALLALLLVLDFVLRRLGLRN
jgi:hypothetical protein